MNKKKKIVVGMSGGVDSSVALMLLKEQGYEPIGVSLKYAVWEDESNVLKENVCCSEESFDRAKAICDKFKAPYHVIDYSQEFKKGVMGYFSDTLKKQQTPNPCLICNRDLKFKQLFAYAQENKIDYVATGHYARVKYNEKDDLHELWQAKDKVKDQSYFLCLLNQAQLAHLVFPLGDLLKEEVYQVAKEQGFAFYLKTKQSQDLCFVSAKSMPVYLSKEIGEKQGQIQDASGKVLGQHKGLHFYTIGQRKGIEVEQGPWYVIDFNRKNNILIISNDEDDPALLRSHVVVKDPHYISGISNDEPIEVEAKIRYSQLLAKAKLMPKKAKKAELVFAKPQRAVTQGQWAVFYRKEKCLGGGIINNSY